MLVPDDLRSGIAAIAEDTGYSSDEVLRFMLEEEIGKTGLGSKKQEAEA